MAQWAKDPVLSLLWQRFDPWPRELFHAIGTVKKKKKEEHIKNNAHIITTM